MGSLLSRENMEDVKVNVGVIGSAKQGRSSLVNALMELDIEDENAAIVIPEQESCKENVKKFTHPKYNNIFLWDLPGVNSYNKDTYEKLITNQDGKRIKFDLFIVVFKDVLNNAVTVDSARLAENMGAKIVFVRTHFDVTVDGIRRARKKRKPSEEDIENSFDVTVGGKREARKKWKPPKEVIENSKQKVRDEIFKTAGKNLNSIPEEKDVYLVDTEDWEEHDLEKLYSDFLNKSFNWIVDKKYQMLKQDSNVLMGIKKASLIFRNKVNQDMIALVITYLNVFDLTKARLQLLEGASEEDRSRLIGIVSEALKGNDELVYLVWSSDEEIDVGGWDGLRKLLEDGSADTATGGYIGSGAAGIAGWIGAELAADTAAVWLFPAILSSAASLAGSAALFAYASRLQSKNCREILRKALDAVKVAAIAKEEFKLELEKAQTNLG